MACYSPLKIKKIGVNLETGKDKYSITKYRNGDDLTGFSLVPCGSCIGCRIDYAKQWADRCMLEAKYHEENYFLTLTYDNDHLDTITRHYTDSKTGEYCTMLSLNKRDVQLWHKNLRKKLDADQRPRIRFFTCGEYGSPENTARPHLHEICFGLHLDDLKFYKYNKLNQPLWTSEYLNEIWKKGFVIVGQVTWESCAYVSRYVMKKQKGEGSEIYREHNIEPPFVLMSRKPGIGRQYYEDNSMFDYRYIPFSTSDGSRKIYPGKYYKSLLANDDPAKFEYLRNLNLEIAENKRAAIEEDTELTYFEQLKVDERSLQNRTRILQRKEC